MEKQDDAAPRPLAQVARDMVDTLSDGDAVRLADSSPRAQAHLMVQAAEARFGRPLSSEILRTFAERQQQFVDAIYCIADERETEEQTQPVAASAN